ncbi:MAG: sulfite exporter TauE/SafE family protein [Burkholderiaceae bacterium]|nr:sulfite exporter TauE/SafE family protein [Burkholderiaceae bacterium]
MDAPLLLAALLMGAAGSLHCTAMCAAACTAVVQRSARDAPAQALLGFHLGRLAGYAAGGAIAAASVNALGAWAQALPAVRPLWSLLHVAALMLGLWLAVTARQPAWMTAWSRAPQGLASGGEWRPVGGPALARLRAPLGAAAVGSVWVALPCGLLQSALLVAALTSTPASGAAVMAAFALASSLGLVVVAAAWRRSVATPGTLRWAVRLAGVMLAGSSAWALGHGLWQQVAAYCFG